MRHASLPLFLLLVLVGTSTGARAQGGPQPGSCELGNAEADLDINNVFARVFNTGSLFYGNQTTAGDGYFVPDAAQLSSVFAAGLWVGGKVGNELRVAGSRYDDFNFWPGPLDDATGRPVDPADCGPFDRIYSVSRADIAAAEASGPSGDVADWPFELGAPVVDGDGNPDNYDFAAGDRPGIIGDQGLWWVMNDVGNLHTVQATGVLGIEVRVLAFAFSRSDALGSSTFYKYTIVNKSGVDITDTYVSVFADPDLGNFADDYVGSDTAAGLGYVYNATNSDAQYGIPPAVGFDFFQGPIVPDGPDANMDPDTLGTSSFTYFRNEPNTPQSDPETGEEIYFFQQGLWGDGTPIRASGDGYGADEPGEITKFAFPGDPVRNQAWSEVNPGTGTPNPPGDRRFAIHTGPFTLADGDAQDIVFGIVYGQGTTNLNSITQLRLADNLAQTAYDAGFGLASPPPAPPACIPGNPVLAPGSGNCFEAVAQNNQLTLVWGYPETSTNYLGQFDQFDVLLAGLGLADTTFTFEGFNLYRYPDSNFEVTERERIATFDVINGITQIVDEDPNSTIGNNIVVANGTDSGLRYSFDVTGLTNFQDQFFGITAYAYSPNSIPKVVESQATNIVGRPSALVGGVQTQSTFGQTLGVTAQTMRGTNSVRARVVDPTRITGDRYEVRFFQPTDANGAATAGAPTYTITNLRTGAIVFDGQDNFNRTGRVNPLTDNVAVVDGFAIDVNGTVFNSIDTTAVGFVRPPLSPYQNFLAVRRADGPLVPAQYAALTGPGPTTLTGFPFVPGSAANPTGVTDTQQVGPAEWAFHQGVDPTQTTFSFFDRITTRAGANYQAIGASDYEWRFMGTSVAYRTTDRGNLVVPFQLWDIGTTVDDATDDIRLIPWMTPVGTTPNVFNVGNVDHAVSTSTNDPFTDLISWYRPLDATPGEAGYNAYAAAIAAGTYDRSGTEIFNGMTLVSVNGGNVTSTANQQVPEEGTIFRIITANPFVAGDVFIIDTSNLQTTSPSASEQEAALDRIAAVPNPYLGGSTYETGNVSRVIRFTNLPVQATTVRIFTVSGSLVRELRTDGSSRTLDWNLETSSNLPVASGMYLVHVDVAGVGERTLKLGIINRRTEIQAF